MTAIRNTLEVQPEERTVRRTYFKERSPNPSVSGPGYEGTMELIACYAARAASVARWRARRTSRREKSLVLPLSQSALKGNFVQWTLVINTCVMDLLLVVSKRSVRVRKKFQKFTSSSSRGSSSNTFLQQSLITECPRTLAACLLARKNKNAFRTNRKRLNVRS